MEDTPVLNKVKWLEGHAKKYLELVKQHDLEEIVQKRRAESIYQIGKNSHDWLKVIN